MNENEDYRKKMIDFLGGIIEMESGKSDGEANTDLMEECGDMLCDLVGNDAAISDDEIEKRIKIVTGRNDTRSHTRKRTAARRAGSVILAAPDRPEAAGRLHNRYRHGIRQTHGR